MNEAQTDREIQDGMRELARQGDPLVAIPRAFIPCPIKLCLWRYEIPPLDPRINSNTLAGVFGPYIMAQHAANEQTQNTERALEEHLATHKFVDWINAIQLLNLDVAVRDLEIERTKAHDELVAALREIAATDGWQRKYPWGAYEIIATDQVGIARAALAKVDPEFRRDQVQPVSPLVKP